MSPLEILYQDDFLVAIDKPAGMIVHPGREAEGVEWIAMKRLRDQLGVRVFPVHRIDRPTSGVLLFALDKETAALAQQAFENRQVSKTYHAIVCGIAPEQWSCNRPLKADDKEQFLPAETHFERLAVTEESAFPADSSLVLSLVQAAPVTGRFHQIRRHLLDGGFPIVGDFRYAGMERCFALGEILGTGTRMLLQAKSLQLLHPHTREMLEITAPLDAEFEKCFPIPAAPASQQGRSQISIADGPRGRS